MPKEHKLFWSCYMSHSQFNEVVEFSAYLVKHSSLFETVFFFQKKKTTIMLVDILLKNLNQSYARHECCFCIMLADI